MLGIGINLALRCHCCPSLGGCTTTGVVDRDNEIVMTFCDTPANASNNDVQVSIDGGGATSPWTGTAPLISGNTVRYYAEESFGSGTVDWIYTAGSLTVGGEAFATETIRVQD